MDIENLKFAEAKKIREIIRKGDFLKPTCGVALGYAQANLAVLPKQYAYDFLLFAFRNPKSCPILDVTDVGDPEPKAIAKGADIRTDIPKYRIYENGELVEEVNGLKKYWREDLVGFLIGCSFTFEKALQDNNIPVRHIEEQKNVPMYITNIKTKPAGIFHGNMVVSMRPIPNEQVVRAVQVTSRFPSVHGAPVHIGNPEDIGIKSLCEPDFGDAVSVEKGETPVFWACGVTPQAVAMASKPKLMITHAPGHMFISDIKDDMLSVI